jgi:hypothetical protein
MTVRPLRSPHERRWSTDWRAAISAAKLRRRLAKEINDDAWRAELKPVKQHPRRERRGQGKPR